MRLRVPLAVRLILPIAFGVACGAPPPDPGGPGQAPPSGDAQARALAALEAETGGSWTVRYHLDVHTPAFLEGHTAVLLAHPAKAATAATGFLTAHGALFLMTSPADELDSDSTISDELGMTHVHFTQRQGSVPVLGGEVSAHFDPSGALVRVHGRYIPVPPIDLVPAVTQDVARAAALNAAQTARPDADPSLILAATPKLAIDPMGAAAVPGEIPGTHPQLAWVVDVSVEDPASPARLEITLDTLTAQPYRTRETLDTLEGSGKGVFGEPQTLQIVTKHGKYFLENTLGGQPAQKTYSAHAGTRLPGREVTSVDPHSWDAQGAGPGAAVDAHAYVALVTAYFATAHGRAGAFDDGKGVRATVHFGAGYDNAFWNGRQLVFGDGDGQDYAPLAGALDVVAHEFTHAVTQSAARLGHEGEPGALNEALSDIFGCFVEASARGENANWQIGEDVYRRGRHDALRDLADPHRTQQPAHLSELVPTSDDRGGIHLHSTIPSHAAWLMTVGGVNAVSRIKVTGMGLADAQKVWYRALTRYLGANANFKDAADATRAAARDLFGANTDRYSAVERAWAAVGVLP